MIEVSENVKAATSFEDAIAKAAQELRVLFTGNIDSQRQCPPYADIVASYIAGRFGDDKINALPGSNNVQKIVLAGGLTHAELMAERAAAGNGPAAQPAGAGQNVSGPVMASHAPVADLGSKIEGIYKQVKAASSTEREGLSRQLVTDLLSELSGAQKEFVQKAVDAAPANTYRYATAVVNLNGSIVKQASYQQFVNELDEAGKYIFGLSLVDGYGERGKKDWILKPEEAAAYAAKNDSPDLFDNAAGRYPHAVKEPKTASKSTTGKDKREIDIDEIAKQKIEELIKSFPDQKKLLDKKGKNPSELLIELRNELANKVVGT